MSENTLNARDFVDARDVKRNILYRKDGCMIGYLRVFSFNLELKNTDARKVTAERLTASFKDDRKDFAYFTLPREIDLDKYKETLKMRHNNANTIGRRHILENMILEGLRLSTSGENYEHQHFMKVWSENKDEKKAEENILERLKDFQIRFANCEIDTRILNEMEITKLCNLFGNSIQASFDNQDNNITYPSIMQLP